jgi:hypothetical protein
MVLRYSEDAAARGTQEARRPVSDFLSSAGRVEER